MLLFDSNLLCVDGFVYAHSLWKRRTERKLICWALRSAFLERLQFKNQLMADMSSCVLRETVSFSVSLEPYCATLTTAAQPPLNTNEAELKECLTDSMT